MATKNDIKEEELFGENVPVENNEAEYPFVHTMVRTISKTGITADDLSYQNVFEIDSEVGMWMASGYKLHSTHLASENEAGFVMIYVLARQ